MGDFAFPGFKKVVWVPDPVGSGGERKEVIDGGLTKREYFAAMAMQGILAKHGHGDLNPHILSSAAIHQADSILEFLSKAIPTPVTQEQKAAEPELPLTTYKKKGGWSR